MSNPFGVVAGRRADELCNREAILACLSRLSLSQQHLQRVDDVQRIDIVYVCSNADIAAQNIRKLNVTGAENPSFATRPSLLIAQPDVLTLAAGEGKPTTFVAFTPATSFQFGRQLGKAEERAVLCVLLRDHLGLRQARATAAERVFQGGVASRRNFLRWHVAPLRARRFEPGIRQAFLDEFDRSSERASLVSLIDEVTGRRALTASQRNTARRIVGGLRRLLARAAVRALEPDLVILDEFQRFRDLLDAKTGEAAELAHDFFTQSDAQSRMGAHEAERCTRPLSLDPPKKSARGAAVGCSAVAGTMVFDRITSQPPGAPIRCYQRATPTG